MWFWLHLRQVLRGAAIEVTRSGKSVLRTWWRVPCFFLCDFCGCNFSEFVVDEREDECGPARGFEGECGIQNSGWEARTGTDWNYKLKISDYKK
jgi:hypothetical protein